MTDTNTNTDKETESSVNVSDELVKVYLFRPNDPVEKLLKNYQINVYANNPECISEKISGNGNRYSVLNYVYSTELENSDKMVGMYWNENEKNIHNPFFEKIFPDNLFGCVMIVAMDDSGNAVDISEQECQQYLEDLACIIKTNSMILDLETRTNDFL